MITAADEVSAANPLIGCSLTILWPSVLMMRQPPPAVPAAITSAHTTFTHTGIVKVSALPGMRRNDSHAGKSSSRCAAVAPTSANAMMPMVFCASFMPCDTPIAAADTSCALPNSALTNGVRPKRRRKPVRFASQPNNANRPPITRKPRMKPAIGEVTIGTTTFGITPLPCHQCAPPRLQMIASKCPPVAAIAAPHRPPTSACEDDDGKPSHHVIRFQIVAPSNAQISNCAPTCATPASINPEAMDLATAVPHSAPSRLVTAASSTALPGVSTLVATTVAIELAVSWKPLM